MEALLLSRWQFAITTTYHFLFVPVTLGLSLFVALLETCYVRTRHPEWKAACKKLVQFFGALFIINFSMGVVTGIVQEFHFGMNWSEYSRFMGDIFGAPLALEALTAFFLESTMLGIWIFGWNRLSERTHCIVIWLTAFASNLSAFWILVANSFMQHPVGYVLNNGRAEMEDFGALLTNHYLIGEFSHTFFSAVATAGFLVIAVSAWKILHDTSSRYAFRQTLKAGAIYMFIGLLGAMGSGHMHTQYLAEANPMKLASMEALWETEDPAPFAVYANINEDAHKNDTELTIPSLFSFMLYNKPTGEVKGINALQEELAQEYGPGDYRPDVTGLFYSFRLMVGLGGLMLLIAFVTFLVSWKKDPSDYPLLMRAIPWLFPIVFIVNSCGWYIAEGGRQPWIVVGLQKTAAAVSPNLTAGDVWITMIGFTAVYLALAVVALMLAFGYIRKHHILSKRGN